jgi:hypothetical protein
MCNRLFFFDMLTGVSLLLVRTSTPSEIPEAFQI